MAGIGRIGEGVDREKSAMDLEALLERTTDAPPCGANLEYDPEFVAIERALRPKGDQLVGEPEAAPAEPDWADLRRRCEGLFARTKDLRVAMTYLRALTRTDQLAGFAHGLDVMSGLLDRYWKDVHPVLDPSEGDDPTMRLNVLAALAPPQGAGGEDPVFRDLRAAMVVPANPAGRVLVRDVLVAGGMLALPESEPATLRRQNEACLRQAAQSDLAAPRRALDALDRIRDCLNERVGADRAPDLKPLRDIVRTVVDAVDAAVPTEPLQAATPHEASAEAAAAASSAGTGGELRSRADAVQRLEEICRFLERTEPANPAPLLLRRAQRLMTKSFMEIIEDIAPGGVEQVRTIAGIRDEQ